MYKKITIYLEDVEGELPKHCQKCGLDCEVVCRGRMKIIHEELLEDWEEDEY